MAKYYGTITMTITGWFKADGTEELLDDPVMCATDCSILTEIVDIDEEVDGKLIKPIDKTQTE